VSGTFDAQHAHDFLTSMYAGVEGYLWVGMFEPKKRGEFFATTAEGIDAAVDYAARLDHAWKPKGLYWRVSTVRQPLDGGKRGGAGHTCALPYLFADLDYGTEGHKGADLPPTVEDAYALVAEAELPEPTLWVHSGGGWYPLWRLADGIGLAETEDALKGVQEALLAGSARRGWSYGDGIGELARVLRMPGSVNRKTENERPCRAESTRLVRSRCPRSPYGQNPSGRRQDASPRGGRAGRSTH
jgi:hypothetical protein